MAFLADVIGTRLPSDIAEEKAREELLVDIMNEIKLCGYNIVSPPSPPSLKQLADLIRQAYHLRADEARNTFRKVNKKHTIMIDYGAPFERRAQWVRDTCLGEIREAYNNFRTY